MSKYRVIMSERVFYELDVECDSDDEVASTAEEAFVQGDYKTTTQDRRRIEHWTKVMSAEVKS